MYDDDTLLELLARLDDLTTEQRETLKHDLKTHDALDTARRIANE